MDESLKACYADNMTVPCRSGDCRQCIGAYGAANDRRRCGCACHNQTAEVQATDTRCISTKDGRRCDGKVSQPHETHAHYDEALAKEFTWNELSGPYSSCKGVRSADKEPWCSAHSQHLDECWVDYGADLETDNYGEPKQ